MKKDLLFQLKMAETAKAKPVEAKPSSNSKEWEFDRPMTSKEKEEYFREKASQARKAGKAQVTHWPRFRGGTSQKNLKPLAKLDLGDPEPDKIAL